MKITKSQLRKIIKKEIKSLNEHTNTRQFKSVMDQLDKAIKVAEQFGEHADRDEIRDADVYSDTTGDLFTKKLRELYNAFMTGSRRDDRSDEIFK